MAGPRKRAERTTELASFGPPVANGQQVPPGSTVFIAEPEPSATEERRARELDEILDALGSDGQVIVYHVINGKTTYAGNMTMDGFSLGTLMDNYGGGDKTLVFMQGNKRVETIRVPLDPSIPITSPRAKEMARQQNAPGASVAAAPAAPSVDLPALITAQASQFSAIMQASQQQSSLMMTTLTTLLTAMMTNKTDPTESFVKMLAVMRENGGGNGQGMNAEQLMALLTKGMEIGARMNGEPDDVMGMVSKGLDTLGVIVTNMVQNKRGAGPVLPVPVPTAPEALTGPVHTGPVPPATPATHEETSMARPQAPVIRPWVDALRPFVPMVVGAVGRMEPEAAADVLTSQLDDAQITDMINDIKAPDFAARLNTYFPAELQAITSVDGGAEWLGKVLESVLEYDESEDEGPSIGQGEESREAQNKGPA